MSWIISRAMMDHCASLHCLPAPAVESLAESCSDGRRSAPSKSTPMPQAYWSPGKTTDIYPRFRFGMTFAHLTADRGAELLTSFRAGFPVRILALQETEPESTESEADCGANSLESLAKLDRGSRSWKTRQRSLVGDLVEFSETWPKWGMTRSGVAYLRPKSERLIREKECGLSHPTPCCGDHKGATSKAMKKKGECYLKYWLHARFPIASTTYPSPELLESVQGFPIGWTELNALETDKFRLWLRSHGVSCESV